MTEFESHDTSHISQKIQEYELGIQIGDVTRVFEHTSADDKSNFEANVSLRDEDKERRRVPIAQHYDGALSVPRKGDMVLVSFLDGIGERPVIIGFLYNDTDRAPVGEEGVYLVNNGNHFVEMHPDGNWMRLSHKEDYNQEPPNAKVEIDADSNITVRSRTGYVNIVEDFKTARLEQSADLAANGGSPFNWNPSSWTTVPWDVESTTSTDNDVFTVQTSTTGDSYIEVLQTGQFRVTVSKLLYFADTGTVIQPITRVTKNGTPLAALNTAGDGTDTNIEQTPGAIHTGPRATTDTGDFNGHAEFSVDLSLQANDTLRIETKENAQTGTANPIEKHTSFTVDQIEALTN